MNHKLIYEKIKDLVPKDKIDALYLFGSYSNGTFTEDSDIDIAIFSDNLTYVELVDLEMIQHMFIKSHHLKYFYSFIMRIENF